MVGPASGCCTIRYLGWGCCLLRGRWGIGLLDGVDFGVSLVSDNSEVGDGVEGPPSDTDIVVSGAGYGFGDL